MILLFYFHFREQTRQVWFYLRSNIYVIVHIYIYIFKPLFSSYNQCNKILTHIGKSKKITLVFLSVAPTPEGCPIINGSFARNILLLNEFLNCLL